MTWDILEGHVLDRLRDLPDESVQCVVTSPPYWGLRDYGTAQWEGGDEGCDHKGKPIPTSTGFNERYFGREFATDKQGEMRRELFREHCRKCGARRIDQQIGLEPTPEEYVSSLVEVFAEVRRVLTKDGTLWLVLGDSYAASGGGTERTPEQMRKASTTNSPMPIAGRAPTTHGLKPKDLVGIPWRVAFALQADGWWLRSDIIWSKPNPMPESVTDRPTKAHEYVFLLTKSARYYYDSEAIKEAPAESVVARAAYMTGGTKNGRNPNPTDHGSPDIGQRTAFADYLGGRNRCSVWEIATHPYAEAHFATFPKALVQPCIRAGSSEKGICPQCGRGWERVTERMPVPSDVGETKGRYSHDESIRSRVPRGIGKSRQYYRENGMEGPPPPQTVGWRPSCSHDAEPVPATILDPFAGSGTVGVVALQEGRSFIGIELNPEYAEMARRRIHNEAGLWSVT